MRETFRKALQAVADLRYQVRPGIGRETSYMDAVVWEDLGKLVSGFSGLMTDCEIVVGGDRRAARVLRAAARLFERPRVAGPVRVHRTPMARNGRAQRVKAEV